MHDRLKKNPAAWTDEHTKVIKIIKASVKSILCLFLANPALPKIVETDASDLGYGGILKQKENDKEQTVQYVSAHFFGRSNLGVLYHFLFALICLPNWF